MALGYRNITLTITLCIHCLALCFPAVTNSHWTSCIPWWRQWSSAQSRIRTGSVAYRTSWRTQEARKEVKNAKLYKTLLYQICLKMHSLILTLCYIPSPLYSLRVCTALCSGLEELHGLVEQAETKAFPQIILLEQLRAVVSEADKVAAMAQQLLNGKRQTR